MKHLYFSKIFLFFTLSISSPFFSHASSLISEDKIWEYYRNYYENTHHRSFMRYKFEGTEERYGKIYHRWVLKDEILESLVWNHWDDPKSYEQEIIHHDVTVALLREEDNRVFLLLDPNESYYSFIANKDAYQIGEGSVLKISDDESHYFGEAFLTPYSSSEGEEIILYDFSNSGQSYETLSLVIPNNQHPTDIYKLIGSTSIKQIESVEYEGETYDLFVSMPEIYNYFWQDGIGDEFRDEISHIKFIPQFGNVGRGDMIVPTPNSGLWSCACDIPDDKTFFNKVTDLEGNVLYSHHEAIEPAHVSNTTRD